MNNIVKLVLGLLLLIHLGCNGNVKAIETNLYEPKEPVVLWFNKEYKKIVTIEIPIGLIIYNNSIIRNNLSSIEYKYSNYTKGLNSKLYLKKGFKRIHGIKELKLPPYGEKDFILYSIHRIDTLSQIQKQFEPYINTLINTDQDKLSIGFVSEFKLNHDKLFKQITHNDTIILDVIIAFGKTEKIKAITFEGEEVEINTRSVHTEKIKIPIK